MEKIPNPAEQFEENFRKSESMAYATNESLNQRRGEALSNFEGERAGLLYDLNREINRLTELDKSIGYGKNAKLRAALEALKQIT